METTGLFTIHKHKIRADEIGKAIHLIPFGDIHRSSPMCHSEKWLEMLEWAKKRDKILFLGMGDYDDLASASERNIFTDRKMHDSSRQTLEDLYTTHVNRLVKEIKFMNGKLIGLMEGNHYAEFQDGTTSTQKMCSLLACKYLGVSSFIRLVVEYRTKSASIDIWAHHGKGASRLIGGSLNRVQQMGESAEADIYLMGHDHKKSVGMMDKLTLSEGHGSLNLHHRKQLYIRTGSFLKAYEDSKVSYVSDMALNPTNLGVVKISIIPKYTKGGDGLYLDLHASI